MPDADSSPRVAHARATQPVDSGPIAGLRHEPGDRGRGAGAGRLEAVRERVSGVSPATVGAWVILALIVAGGLAVRLINNDYGMPYVFNYDEETHFVSRAVDMFAEGGFNPGYYQNPSAYTYILLGIMRVLYGGLPLLPSLTGLPFGTVGRQFDFDPTPFWVLGRSVAAVLAVFGAVAVYAVGSRLWSRQVGLVAAAILCFAFLGVAYSRVAVTDVGTFVPVAISVFASLRVLEHGRRRDYLLAGAATGLAIAFKYTAGLVLLPLLLAYAARLRDQLAALRTPRALLAATRAADGTRRRLAAVWSLTRRPETRSLVLAGVGMVAVFGVTNPFFFLNPIDALYELKVQAEAAGLTDKFGQTQSNGFLYYLTSLTWGLGWLACAAALVGAAFEFRRSPVRAFMLALFPVALLLYLSTQSRFFSRWLLPAYPVLALLAAVGIARLAQAVPGHKAVKAGVLAAIAAVVLIQPVLADVRSARVLGAEDTRNEARRFVVANFPPDLRLSIESGARAVPDSYYEVQRPSDPAQVDLCTGLGKTAGATEPPGCTPLGQQQFVAGYFREIRRAAKVEGEGGILGSINALKPALIDRYRRDGICLVMTMGTVRGRIENAGAAAPLAYYRRLERESDLIFAAEPFKPGRKPLPFSFDFSYNYYPTAFERPGPPVGVYRLRDCRPQSGEVQARAKSPNGLDKGLATSVRGPVN